MDENILYIKLNDIYEDIVCQLTDIQDAKFLWVSDSIILSSSKGDAHLLLEMMLTLQAKLFSLGLSVRGGISVGSLYFERNIWGMPMIEAVELEIKANYPRIIISYSNLEELNLEEGMRQLFVSCKDGYYYFDFFLAAIRSYIENERHLPTFLGNSCNVICMNYNQCANEFQRSKWIWLSNEFIRAMTICRTAIDAYDAQNCSADDYIARVSLQEKLT